LNVGKRKKVEIRFKKGRRLYKKKSIWKRDKERKTERIGAKKQQKIIEEDIYKITKEEEIIEWKDRC
jgi:hypothetical protein